MRLKYKETKGTGNDELERYLRDILNDEMIISKDGE